MLRALLLLSLVVLTLSGASAQQAIRITCENVTGSRVEWIDNPSAPADLNRKLTIARDGIDGARVEITFSSDSSDAQLIVSGNVNKGGRVTTAKLVRLEPPNGYLTFVGTDPGDGAMLFLSYFPKVQRLIWSSHNDRTLFMDRVALGKTFIATCSAATM